MYHIINGPDMSTLFTSAASAIITAMISIFINRALQQKVKLVWYILNVGSHKITCIDPNNTIHINTHVIAIKNQSKLPAKDIKIGHKNIPPSVVVNYNVLPSREYEEKTLLDGTQEIRMPEILPQEVVTITYVYPTSLLFEHINSYVKHSEAYAKHIDIITAQRFPKWFYQVFLLVSLIGTFTIIYGLLKLIVLIYF